MPTNINRRKFLAVSGIGAAGVVTGLGTTLALAAPGTPNTGDVIVAVLLRGGCDGLSMAPPYGYQSYRNLRPTIAIPPPGQNNGALALNSATSPTAAFPTGIENVVGLHPAMQPIHETLWAQGRLAVLPATGMDPNESRTRSHFRAEEYLERGARSDGVGGGFLGRMINAGNFPGLLNGVNTSGRCNMLDGGSKSVLANDLDNFGLTGFRNRDQARTALASLNSGPDSVSAEGRLVLDVVDQLQSLDGNRRPGYPNTGLSRQMSEVATVIKANIGVQAATVELGGWDHHRDLGAPGDTNGRFHRRAAELADALRAFADDTNQLEEITVVVLTEFGRTINENGNRGTDHGAGATHMVMGGGIRGGVYGDDYPDVIQDNPQYGDLTIHTDYRKYLSEVVLNRGEVNALDTVFPTYTQNGFLGLTA
ncbi:MAG: DUF1501 domain-containing protein [Actinomycetota bacterium]